MLNKLKKFYQENEKDGKVNGMLLKSWLKKNQDVNEYLENLLKQYPNFNFIANIIYCLIRDIDFNSIVCKNCGKPLNVRTMTQLSNYCSTKCAMSDPELQKRKAETIASDPDYYKKRQEKIIKTNIERYGTKTPAQNKDVAQKMKDTWAKDPDHWKKRNEKSEKTCMERYGVKNPYNIKEVQDKSIATKLAKQYDDFKYFDNFTIPLFTKEEWMKNEYKDYLWKCVKCGNEFYVKREHGFVVTINVPKCKKCIPNRISNFQIEIMDFCKKYFSNILFNTRSIINPQEVDIAIPDIKLAIECNGIYWHTFYEDMYHLNKTIECNKNGYRLVHIWEDEWNSNKDLIKQKLIDIFENKEIIDFSKPLDRSWYNNLNTKNILKEVVEPNEINRNGHKLFNCGYLIYEN